MSTVHPQPPPPSARRIALVWMSIWLLFLIYPAADIVRGHYSVAGAVLAALWLAAFAVSYLFALWTSLGSDPRHPETNPLWPLGLLMVVAVPMLLIFGGDWVGAVIYLAVACGFTLPARPAYVAVVLLVLFQIGLAWKDAIGIAANWDLYLLTAGLGAMMVFWRRQIGLMVDIREAREEMARLAVSDERLRIARDLHDVLGHSLSVIALKAQVARRTMTADSATAQAALVDVEAVARDSLREVREMVAGYREQSLEGELRGAVEVLAAAGIDLTVRRDLTELPKPVDGALAWAVREGVSNVVRHSHARRCAIAIAQTDEAVRLEMTDDGSGSTAGETGHGLRGLRERLAKLGGTLDTGPAPDGGFRLHVRVPVAAA